MHKNEEIIQYLSSKGITTVSPIIRDTEDKSRIYAFISVKRGADDKISPSNYTLRLASDSLAKFGHEIHFIITGDKGNNIEYTIKSTLLVTFPEAVRNVFSSPYGGKFLVWVEPKRTLTAEDASNIKDKCKDILKVIEKELYEVRFTSAKNIPTRTLFLKLIRLHSPASKEKLSERFIHHGFHVPSEEWLSKSLDALRKAGFVIRRKDGGYVLTYLALQKLGSSKGNRSPDIARALDLARRDS